MFSLINTRPSPPAVQHSYSKWNEQKKRINVNMPSQLFTCHYSKDPKPKIPQRRASNHSNALFYRNMSFNRVLETKKPPSSTYQSALKSGNLFFFQPFLWNKRKCVHIFGSLAAFFLLSTSIYLWISKYSSLSCFGCTDWAGFDIQGLPFFILPSTQFKPFWSLVFEESTSELHGVLCFNKISLFEHGNRETLTEVEILGTGFLLVWLFKDCLGHDSLGDSVRSRSGKVFDCVLSYLLALIQVSKINII